MTLTLTLSLSLSLSLTLTLSLTLDPPGIVPKPGQGPSAEYMEQGYLTVEGTAKGSGGTVIKSTMQFHCDPGYKGKSKIYYLCHLCLAH